MSFLTPLFLLGALAVAGPVLLHLIRRTPRERVRFSSLLLLRPSPPRRTRRSRVDEWPLLLLRCLALGLLALGFARPFLQDPTPRATPRGERQRLVLLVDTSASLRREGLWTAARGAVESALRRVGPADEVALVTFSRGTEVRVTFEEWQRTPEGGRAALVLGRLDAHPPGGSGTHLGAALVRASDLLAESSGQESSGIRRVLLVSDLQSGSHLEALQSYEWPKEMELEVVPVGPGRPGNASLQWLPETGEADASGPPSVRVRVSNTADATREEFQLGWATADGRGFLPGVAPVAAYVPPGQNRTFTLEVPARGAEAGRILLAGDAEGFDDLLHVAPAEAVRSTVLYWGTEAASDALQPAAFLRDALPATRRRTVSLEVRPPDRPAPAAELDGALLYVVAAPLPESVAAELRRRVLGGKLLWLVLRDPGMAETARRLLGSGPLAVTEAAVRDYAMFGPLDFSHPCLAPFADPRFSDFTRIHFWRHRRVAGGDIPGARWVARFDSGDPALLDVPAGRGRVLLLATGWNPEDSQLALSTKFVPLVHSVLDLAGGAAAATGQVWVGEAPDWPAGLGSEGQPVTLVSPSGATVALAAPTNRLPVAEEPGIHVLHVGTNTFRYAANLDPMESRTTPLSVDALERLGAPVRHAASTALLAETSRTQARLQSQELEGRQKLWRWFLVATLAVLLGEILLAGRAQRRVGETSAGAG